MTEVRYPKPVYANPTVNVYMIDLNVIPMVALKRVVLKR
jgi:hypothetical protein